MPLRCHSPTQLQARTSTSARPLSASRTSSRTRAQSPSSSSRTRPRLARAAQGRLHGHQVHDRHLGRPPPVQQATVRHRADPRGPGHHQAPPGQVRPPRPRLPRGDAAQAGCAGDVCARGVCTFELACRGWCARWEGVAVRFRGVLCGCAGLVRSPSRPAARGLRSGGRWMSDIVFRCCF